MIYDIDKYILYLFLFMILYYIIHYSITTNKMNNIKLNTNFINKYHNL